MRGKSIAVLVVALGCGLVASLGITQVLGRKSETAPQGETVSIYLAKADLLPGALPGEENVKTELWPKDPLAETRAMSLIGFFAATVHPAHAHISRPERYATDPSHFPDLQDTGRKAFLGYLQQIDGLLAGREWLSDSYSVLDPYAFTFYFWGFRRELPVGEMKNFTAFRDRMLQRPAVRRIVEDEKVKV